MPINATIALKSIVELDQTGQTYPVNLFLVNCPHGLSPKKKECTLHKMAFNPIW